MIGDRTHVRPHTQRSAVPPESAAALRAEVTAVVVTHNSGHHLASLGDAFSASTLRPERMLAVDNRSCDESVAHAQTVGFEVHETGTNDGFGAACNVALQRASTEFVLFCNPDVSPAPDAIELLLAALLRTPTAAVAGVAFDRPFLARRFSRLTGDIWTFLPAWLQRPLGHFSNEVPVDPRHQQVVVDYVVGAFMLCRVAALRSVGGFDEGFFLYCEEEDLCRRLGANGWSTLFVGSATVAHRHSTSSRGVDRSVMAQFLFHSLYLYYRKYYPRWYAELARCVHSSCMLVDRLYRRLTRQPQAYSRETVGASFRNVNVLQGGISER